MKKGILFVLFMTFVLGSSMAQQVLVKGKAVAEVKNNGDVSINGKFVGIFDKNGDVYKKGERVGQIRPNGEFWVNGSKSGKFEADGTVYKSNAVVGKVEFPGEVFDVEKKKIASGKGIKREWLAGLFFFYFKDELLK